MSKEQFETTEEIQRETPQVSENTLDTASVMKPVSEKSPSAVAKEIRELKEKIQELTEGKERVNLLKRTYNVPDEALTESDLAVLQTSDAELREKLAVLTAEKKATPSLVRRLARRAAVFLSL